MTKIEIIEQMAKNKTVEEIAKRFLPDFADDISQSVYLDLLEKDNDELIQDLYNKNEINYYIVGTIKRMINKGKWYRINKQLSDLSEPLTDFENGEYQSDKYSYDITLKDVFEKLTEYESDLFYELSQEYHKKKIIESLSQKYNVSGRKIQLDYYNILNKIRKMYDGHTYLAKRTPKYYTYQKKEKILKKVYQYTKDGIFIKEWRCAADAARELELSVTTIHNCCKNNGINFSCGGYKWSYDFNSNNRDN